MFYVNFHGLIRVKIRKKGAFSGSSYYLKLLYGPVEFPVFDCLKEHEKYTKSPKNVKKNISYLFLAQGFRVRKLDVWP